MFSFRCFTKFTKKSKLTEYLEKYSTSVIACVEKCNTDQEHIHAVINTSYSVSSLRKSLKKILIETGNKVYSIKKTKDIEKAYNYTCKDNKIYYLKGFTEDDVVSYYKRYHSYNKKMVKNKDQPYYCVIFDRIKDDSKLKEYVLRALKDNTYFWTESHIFRKIVIGNYIKDSKTFPNKFQIDNITNSLFSRLLLHYGVSKKDTINVVYSMIFEDDEPKYTIDPVSLDIQNYIYEK